MHISVPIYAVLQVTGRLFKVPMLRSAVRYHRVISDLPIHLLDRTSQARVPCKVYTRRVCLTIQRRWLSRSREATWTAGQLSASFCFLALFSADLPGDHRAFLPVFLPGSWAPSLIDEPQSRYILPGRKFGYITAPLPIRCPHVHSFSCQYLPP